MKKVVSAVCILLFTVMTLVPLSYPAYDKVWDELWITSDDNPSLECDIKIFENGDGKLFAFLPRDMEAENVVIRSYFGFDSATGDDVVSFDPDEGVVTCRASDGASATIDGHLLTVMRGSLPVMNVTVGSGHTISETHRSRDVKIPVSVGITGTDGGKYDLSPASAEIKTRGYSTFDYPKKPYQIKFDKKTDLFGMGKAKKWILLANYLDGTAVRNKVIFDLGEEIGCEYVPSSVFVDLYIDGEYCGVYQLAEKVEIGSSRVDVSDEYAVLLELDVKERLDEFDIFFTLPMSGKAVVFKDYVTDFEETRDEAVINKARAVKAYVSNYMKQFEALLYSQTTPWSEIERRIDVDSFIRYYFISEFSEEVDATFASTFFYMDGKDDVLHCDPLWDYDRCLGFKTIYDSDERTEFLKNITVTTDGYRAEWFKQLFRYSEFADRVNEMYDEYCKASFKEEAVVEKIERYQSEIMSSLIMDHTVYPAIFYTLDTLAEEIFPDDYDPTIAEQVEFVTDEMIYWIENRSDFLESAYGADIPRIRYSPVTPSGSLGKSYTGGLTEGDFNVDGLKVAIESGGLDGGIEYSVMYAGKVFGPASDGDVLQASTDRITGIAVELTGNIANYYSVEYRILQRSGETSAWARDGAIAGARSGSFSKTGVMAFEIRLIRREDAGFASLDVNTPNGEYSVTGVIGNEARLTPPEIAGYEFEGWYLDAEHSEKFEGKIIFGNIDKIFALYKEKSQVIGDADADGALSMKDVLVLRRCIAGLDEVPDGRYEICDADGDGVITMKDVLLLRRAIAGI